MPVGRILLKSITESKRLSLLKTDGARLLFTWLIPLVDINGCYSGDAEVVNGKVFTRLRKRVADVEGYLADLERVGLIVRYKVDDDTFLHVPSFQSKQPNLNPGREAKPTIPLPTQDLLQSSSRPTQEEIPLKLSKVKLSKVKSNAELRSAVVQYLNEKAGKNFNPETKTTAQLIDARIAEGRTLDDFKRVIDIKVAKWNGDHKMDDFLRPETLFDLTKMEAYLNEAPPKPPGDARVGAHAPRTPEQIEQDNARKRAVEGERQRLAGEYEPKIEAAMGAGKIEEAKRLNDEMTGQVERFASAWGRVEA